jgi:protein gp37
MAETTKMKDYDHSINFWIGCTKFSEGCDHCYAEAMNKRYKWIPDFSKITRAKGAWKLPYKWQKQAASTGKIDLVYGNSTSEFWHPQADKWRAEVWKIVKDTPNLIWRFQTKRPELIADRLPKDWGNGYPNVWLGVTVEMKKYLHRLDTLCKIPAVVHLLNAEPLLEDLTPELADHVQGLDYVWVGGENGPHCCPFDMQWARNIRDLCYQHNIPFTFGGPGGVHQRNARIDGVKYASQPQHLKTYRRMMRQSSKTIRPLGEQIQLAETAARLPQ